jgi:predicted ATPase/DNA-binding XRE family transcriptional regulator
MITTESHSFGDWLRRRRKALDWTQAELARRVNCTAATIRKIEADERKPSRQLAELLLAQLQVPADQHAAFLHAARHAIAPDDVSLASATTLAARSLNNLPAPLTALIGREHDAAILRNCVLTHDTRLVTLIGPPGIGKTRLSLQVATDLQADFADGVFFVPLASITNPNLVAPVIEQTLGLVRTDQRSDLERLKEGINDRQLLIVLDNFEQIIEAASIAPELLAACPRLKLIVTSRESLRVPGEWLYPVPTLTIPDETQSKRLSFEVATDFSALRLFIERARAVRPDFALTSDNFRTVATICRQLDGLPLAIELIAARIRLMSPQALLSRLTSDFMLRADGMRGVSFRQKTLHQAIAWSYDLLDLEEQKLFAALSVFSGGFTPEAAQAVTQIPNVIAGLTSLLDKSLLVRAPTAHDEVRFSQLVMIRDFALDRLRERHEEAALRDRLLVYFLDLAEVGDQKMRGPDQVEWGARLENEYDNFRAALEWSVSTAKSESALRLLCALGWPWEVGGHYREARTWLDKIRALPDISNYPDRYARLLNHVGRFNLTLGNGSDGRDLLEESEAISQKLGSNGSLSLAEALNWQGLHRIWFDHDPRAAKAIFARSLELNKQSADPHGVALSTFHLGIAEIDLTEYESALAHLEKSLTLFRQYGDLFFIARVSLYLGYLFLNQRNYDQARSFFEQHLKIDTQIQYWDGMADGWYNLGNLFRQQSKYEQASRCYEESVIVRREHGLDRYYATYDSGLLALYCNDYTLAAQRFTHLLSLVRNSDKQENVGALLTGSAAVAGGIDQPERAARLSGAAQAYFEIRDDRIPPLDQAEFDRHIQIARQQLGEARFAALQAEGHALSLDKAIELALSE